jgi:two-component system, sensor histidine kinase YesM
MEMLNMKTYSDKINLLFHNTSLIRKLILAYILIIAIPIIMFALYTFNNFETSTKLEVLRAEQNFIQNLNFYISRNIEICEKAAQSIIANRQFIEFLSQKEAPTTEELINFANGPYANVQRIYHINPDIHRIKIYIDTEFIPEFWPIIFDQSRLKDGELISKINSLKGGYLWNYDSDDFVPDYLTRSPDKLVSLYSSVRDIDNKYLGILEISMLNSVFFRDLLTDERKEHAFTYFADRNENLFYDESQPFLKEYALDIENHAHKLTSNLIGEEGSYNVTLEKKDMILIYSFNKDLNAYICKLISNDKITDKISDAKNFIIFGTIGVIFLLSLVTYFITSIILKKMRIIIESMRRVQRGEFNIDIPVRGSDEIGELAHHFRKMLRKINELIFDGVKRESAAKDAEIRALHSQINAHFLYNVLESIKMMAEIQCNYDVSDALTSLGSLMRYSIKWSKQHTTLGEELQYIRDYISLLNIRFENEIVLNVSIDDNLLNCEVPKMALQPIVENSIEHGFEPKNSGGVININAAVSSNTLYINIRDNGIGMSNQALIAYKENIELNQVSDKTAPKSNGIALRNVNERIKLAYGKEFGINITSEINCFTNVEIQLPCINYIRGYSV